MLIAKEAEPTTQGTDGNPHLSRVLKPIHLWALAVGLVISGDYFGWSYGFGVGGPWGLAISLIPVTLFYVTFILSYSELATAIPHAGGPSAYARRAMGPFMGYLTGMSCLIEFIFAPPAVALAIGSYIHFVVPAMPAMPTSVAAFILFIFINYLGMKTSATFELVITIIASAGLVVFALAAAPHFSMARLTSGPLLPFGWTGVMAAVPFAIWFYLAIEGGAMAAEECVNPQKDIPKGFLGGMGTLLVMAFVVLFLTAGIADYNLVTSVDFPLPIALAQIFGNGSFIVILISGAGLFGLIASLHGIVIGASRQTYAMARSGYLPKFLAYVDPKHHSPVMALLLCGIIGIAVTLTGLTAMAITIACFGSIMLYFLSLISLFVLRTKEPNLKRPFRVWYPVVPIISLLLAVFCLFSVAITAVTALEYTLIIYVIAIVYYFIWGNKNIRPFAEEFGILDELDA